MEGDHNEEQEPIKRNLDDRGRTDDVDDGGEGANHDGETEVTEGEVLGESPAKKTKLDDSTSSDEEQEGRDPGKAEYKEFSKALRALHTLTTEPEDSRDEEHTWRLREMSGKVRQLCNQDVGDGEVPNPLKLLQIHLKHILMQSDKVKDEENVKNFLNGLEDGSAGKSDDDDTIFVFLAKYATELWYQWNEDELQWYWTPDHDHHMPCSADVVTGGQWEGETPAPENVEIIAYLDAIRPIPSDEQYIPSLEFNVLSILRSLAGCSDATVHDNAVEVVRIWRAVNASTGSKHVKLWKKELDSVLALVGLTLNIRNITLAVREVVEWYRLGVALNIEGHKLDEIRVNRMNHSQHCKFSLIDVWLRTDVNASWSKLAAALDEVGEDTAAGRIKEQYLGLPATSPVTPGAVLASLGSGQPRPVMMHAHSTGGIITSDGPAVMTHVPVPISAQAPVSSVTEAVHLLRTSQERLISGLTHSKLNVNFAGANAQGMTLLHYAAMQGADVECLKALIAFGASINPLNTFGQTPLDVAAMSPTGEDMVVLLETIGAVSGAQLTHQQQPLRQQDAPQNPDACNILSLSSSGPYCIVQLETLQQVEVQSGCRVTDLFQWVVACGFGALFLLLIIYGNKTMADVKRLYFKLREEVFGQQDMARRSLALDGFLQAHLGTQMKMSDIQHPRILIGALYKGSTKVETHLFNNCLLDDFSAMPVWKVARYTCSVPLNIMESDNYTSTDPALPNLSSLGLRRIQQFYKDTHQDPGIIKSLVCVEAGQFDAQALGCVDVPVAALSDNPHWFISQGALLNVAQLLSLQQSSAIASGEECLKCCQEQCEFCHIQFYHFNPLLSRQHTLSVDVSLKDVVDSVIETISQVCGKPLDSLVTFLNNI